MGVWRCDRSELSSPGPHDPQLIISLLSQVIPQIPRHCGGHVITNGVRRVEALARQLSHGHYQIDVQAWGRVKVPEDTKEATLLGQNQLASTSEEG